MTRMIDLANVLYMKKTGEILPDASLSEILFSKHLCAGSVATVTGNPVKFSSCAAQNALSTVISFDSESGISEINLFGCGKNLFQTTASSTEMAGVTYTVNEDGTVSVSGTATGFSSFNMGEADINGIHGKITVSGIATATNIQWSNIRLYDSNNTVVYETLALPDPSVTIDLDDYPTAVKVVLIIKRINNVATSGIVKPIVEIGDTASTYEQYTQGVNLTISLGDTYYDGSLDLENGTLTADGQTVSLTPQTVAVLAGVNTMWTDGESITIKYRR